MGLFESIRLVGVNKSDAVKHIEVDDNYSIAIQQREQEQISKAMNNKEVAYSQPVIGSMSANPGFKTKPSIRNNQDLHGVLKKFGGNIILNAIINTRSNQVSMYCKPARHSEKGVGFEVRLKDLDKKPTSHDEATIKRIESFIEKTGIDNDINRDSFSSFVKKIVRDTYMYDQVNFEKVFNRNQNMVRFVAKDPQLYFLRQQQMGKFLTTVIGLYRL
ncbi:hypothetical protein [Listeria phage LMTA-148]|uniref:Uncharacterized protein n=1 Tax=Listeria phage LMTA-148 TaxID=1486413 RepID=A0A068CBV8_9CAUD|nr:portal protein [Listeria phage LMTA-148]AID17364.1 hypothetical protein [Listeria phage LMTA-148]